MQVRTSIVAGLIVLGLAGSVCAPTPSLASVLKCKIDRMGDSLFITTSPDTKKTDGPYARIGISPGVGSKAIVFTDRMGAVAFVELNADGTPIGLLTVQKDMRVIKPGHAIDPYGVLCLPHRK